MATFRNDQRSNADKRIAFKSSDSRPCSKIGLLEESFDPASCTILPLKDAFQQSGPLQTLDASRLIRNCTSQSSISSNNDNRSGTNNIKSLKRKLSSSGLDNNGFTLECVENSAAGSRKPVIDVDYRTIANEQLIVSQYCNLSSRVLNSNGPISCGSSSYEISAANSGTSRITGADGTNTDSGNKASLQRVGTPRPRGKLIRGRPCQLPLRTFNNINENPYYHRTPCIPWSKNTDALRLHLNSFILNNNFISDSDSSVDSSSETLENNSSCDVDDIQVSNETSVSLTQKTKNVKKTQSAVSQWRKPATAASVSRDMVQLGCASRPQSGHYTNSINVSPSGPYVSNVNTVSVSAGVSIRNNALISPLRSVGKISNVRGSSSITTTPTVSALTKVSSVRIVPTPTSTPTPSVTGNSENGSTKLAPPPQRAPFKQNLQESLSPSAIARPEPRQLENVASNGNNTSSVQPSAVTSTTVNAGNLQLNANSLSTYPLKSHHSQNQSASISIQQFPSSFESNQIQPSALHYQSQSVSITNQTTLSQPPPVSTQSSTVDTSQETATQTSQLTQVITNLPASGSSRPPVPSTQVMLESDAAAVQRDIETRRGDRERRRERRERRRERRAQRLCGALLLPSSTLAGQTDLSADNVSSNPIPPNARLPDLLNSHVPPPYSTLPNGARTHGGLLPPPHPPGPLLPGPMPPGTPQPLPIHLQHHPPGVPMPPGYPPPPTPGSPIRPPPDCPWPFFGSRRYVSILKYTRVTGWIVYKTNTRSIVSIRKIIDNVFIYF